MKVIDSISTLRQTVNAWRRNGESVGFVPTMGNLHDGHLKLVKKAKAHNDNVVVSIFVNPMQFGANEDLDAYPRTIEEDKAKLISVGADAVFLPSVAEMYPAGLDAQTFVEVPGISDSHCGASRPGHFRGVATVVTKLFNMVQPDDAFFGEKDFQQLQVIRALARDLSMAVTIHGVPTEREASGLAMSSRNGYLSKEEKATASAIYEEMQRVKAGIEGGNIDFSELEDAMVTNLEAKGFKKDYCQVVNASTFKAATANDKELVLLVAMFMGKTRLIDNLQITR
ncbi:pantothenate synthetase [Alteromonas mediterranea MED64]|jgi:pantoate--beta-alanine ligase|uniref:Pantothenate synthetase n=3 Tax=Alteromonas mediterranea TaxID=314275 RepID=PANC_ALTMD|nr:pantoate--beta-alanine ligase [Alteromonas mediterranea]B4RYN9.1 RecName: Full=Pantothenate synthetase; Short=PS; AltName: Full=Pantoate--beta-alanine ligase; AltName: Full=Pantoate-activating enzyme [Alteromonas mediterranea DE]AEA99813.1 pantoate--beta-alanine ligase [Alteromonas mediterranea DE]AGP83411.1 pantothenate synthetase [Alteromonas mediterranea MED64]CAH1189311.1 Pantothenate synthetase [Alteromonas mediterranea]|tara:strand:- start:4043 stop:4891 length:849 start_codon:yes stop_codon:yes gene_type:complete